MGNLRYDNKESALDALTTHAFTVGELFAVSYKSETWNENTNPNGYDVLVAVGVADGMGNDFFKVCSDKGLDLYAAIFYDKDGFDLSEVLEGLTYLVRDSEANELAVYSNNNGTVHKKVLETGTSGIAIDSVSNTLYIYSAPVLINPIEVACRPSLDGVVFENGELSIKIDTGEAVYEDLHFVDAEEKAYLVEKVFDKNFNMTITGQKLDKDFGPTTSTDPCVVAHHKFTLLVKYGDNLVDLNGGMLALPGFSKDETVGVKGTYYYTVDSNVTTSSPSGKTGEYTKGVFTGSKTVPSATNIVQKWWAIIYSETMPSVDNFFKGIGTENLVSSVSGTYKVTPGQGEYVWFIIPESMKPSKITQFGVNYVDSDVLAPENIKKNGVNIGNYRVYRSLNNGNGLEQTVVIS